MFERSEFLPVPETSEERRDPAVARRAIAGKAMGCPFSVYSFWARKKSKTSPGTQPLKILTKAAGTARPAGLLFFDVKEK
jgi:hypothetical protein